MSKRTSKASSSMTITPPTSPSRGVRHGACNAHHLRELQALIDIEKEDWAKSMHRLLERAHRATRFSRENGRDVPASLGARISRARVGVISGRIGWRRQASGYRRTPGMSASAGPILGGEAAVIYGSHERPVVARNQPKVLKRPPETIN